MASGKKMMMVVVVMLFGLGYGGKWAEAQVHHVVGDDPGWHVASNIASWAAGRIFTVGDFLWFAYSGGIDKENVVELSSKEEYESCDVSNPIKMYTDGLDKIPLEEEGIRYFASSNPHNCKKGLKLHVEVRSNQTAEVQSITSLPSSENAALAQQPSAPSSSIKMCGPIMMIIVGVIFSHVTLYV